MDARTHSFEIIDPTRDASWDGDLLRYPGAGFFHGAAWARVLRASYGFEPLYLRALNEGRSVALLPLFEIRGPLGGRKSVSLPFTDDCAPLSLNEEARQALWAEALRLGHERRWRSLETRGGEAPPGATRSSCDFHGHRLLLNRVPETLLATLPAQVRRAVRKAGDAGLQVRFSTQAEAIGDYHRLHCQTRRHHGLPPQSLGFFRHLHREAIAQGQGCVALVTRQEEPIAGAVFLWQGATVLYKFGASSRDSLGLRPNNLLFWEAIRHFGRQGFLSLDFGRTSLSNEGLRRFKTSWLAGERIISYYHYDFRRSGFTLEPDRVSGLHNHLFRLLPLWLSRLAGNLLYRYAA